MEWTEYLDLQDDDLPVAVDGPTTPPPPATPPAMSLDDLAEELCIPLATLAEIDELIRDRKQMIFTGPPGTGKTFVARRLARLYTDNEDTRFEFIQFHPSYAYEDFVEGYKPRTDDSGALSFAVEKGPLRELVRKAQIAKDAADASGEMAPVHMLVIDEINRANLSRVFGELFFALEYRDTPVRLQYSPTKPPLRLPENLWIIGTMNTADRSAAIIDSALRRRFYFFDFSPMVEPFDGLLHRFLTRLQDQGEADLRWLARVIEVANDRLPDPRFAVGPSYFMRNDISAKLAERAWKHTVIPYLSDRFPDLVEDGEFDWNVLSNEALGRNDSPTGEFGPTEVDSGLDAETSSITSEGTNSEAEGSE